MFLGRHYCGDNQDNGEVQVARVVDVVSRNSRRGPHDSFPSARPGNWLRHHVSDFHRLWGGISDYM
jgi:hypothetical protein